MSYIESVLRGRPVAWLGVAVVSVLLASSILFSGLGGHLRPTPSSGLSVDQVLPVGLRSYVSPNAQHLGEFGWSVATNGTAVVVGAPAENASDVGAAGNAYIFGTKAGLPNDGLLRSLRSLDVQVGGEFGYSLAISGTTVVVGAPGETTAGQAGAGHAYLYNATTGVGYLTLTSPNDQAGGGFGSAVAINGTTVVVGAPHESASGHAGAGRAYVFNATNGSLTSTLASPHPHNSGGFGSSVGISGPAVLVGAPQETASGHAGSGHAYLYNATSGALIRSFTSPNADVDGYFGTSVGLSGTAAVVGAPGETASGVIGAGHAYLFNTKNGHATTITDPYTLAGSMSPFYFGYSTAISGARLVVGGGDVSSNVWTFAAPSGSMLFYGNFSDPGVGNDSFGASVAITGTEVAVGAPLNWTSTNPLFRPGSAYAFEDIPFTISAPPPSFCTLACFGWYVDLSGTTVVLGAPDETVSGETDAGQVWILNAVTGVLNTLTNPDPQVGGYFGWSVAISGTTIVVGAPGELGSAGGGAPRPSVPGADAPGQAYIFKATTGALIATLSSPNAQSGGEFGYSVAISGPRVVIGAPGESVGGVAQAGNAYVFSTTGTLIEGFVDPNYQPGGEFGASVGIAGTLVAVGAPFDSLTGYGATGGVYTFGVTQDKLYATLTSPSMQANEEFGASVAVSGTTVVVGAPDATASGATSAGGAFTFNGKTGARIANLTDPDAQSGGNFGCSVGISGTTAVVGADDEASSGFSEAGDVYTFGASTGDLVLSLTSPNAQSDGYFGESVAISGTSVVAGAPGEAATAESQAGHAYLF